MGPLRGARFAGVAAGGATLAAVLGLLLAVRAGRSVEEVATASEARQAVLAPAFGVAAWIVLRARPGNRFGWLLLAQGGLHGLSVLLPNAVALALPGPLPRLLAPVAAVIWLPAVALGIGLTPLLYPDGRLPSRRWIPVVWLAVAGGALLTGAAVLSREIVGDVFPDLPHPYAPAVETVPVALAGLLMCTAAGIAGLAGMAWRWRRADPPQRGQHGWFLVAMVVLCAPLATDSTLLQFAGVAGFPLCLAAAVVRYGWFDGDRILSRTAGYAILTTLIIAAFGFGVGVLGETLGGAGLGAVAAAVAIAVFLAPVHQTVQRLVDRVVYGERRDPYAALTRLGRRLQDAPDPDEVLPAVVESVRTALRAPYAAVVMAGEREPAAHAGEVVTAVAEVPLRSSGSTVATLVVGLRPGQRALDVADEALLSAFAGQVAPAVAGVALTRDLMRARERLVTAREEERRRIRRDLHDGLGPTFAGLALGAEAAARAAERAGSPLAESLRALHREAQAGLAEVRRIAHDLRPAALDELGLCAAVRQHVETVAAAAGFEAEVEMPDHAGTLPAAVEVAAYRIALEAVTNVARHACAQRCRVEIAVADRVTVTVTDDGIGLPDPVNGHGVGLRSMAERATELGGTFSARPLPGGGTRVTAGLPVEVA